MWPDRVTSPGPLALKSGALLTALPGPAAGETCLRLTAIYAQHIKDIANPPPFSHFNCP